MGAGRAERLIDWAHRLRTLPTYSSSTLAVAAHAAVPLNDGHDFLGVPVVHLGPVEREAVGVRSRRGRGDYRRSGAGRGGQHRPLAGTCGHLTRRPPAALLGCVSGSALKAASIRPTEHARPPHRPGSI
jgi:hypothetical protein